MSKRKAGRARISQCMIVKNEESNIERALSWGKGIVSEQIVVDTGSTDRTVEIARQMGAKVYEFQWIDDFAAAKNYAISKARYEWIAFLDADEYFLPEDGKRLLELVYQYQDTSIECIMASLINLDDDGKVTSAINQVRIFKNIPSIRYHGRIHEAIVTTDGHMADTVNMTKELAILHTGYGAKEKSKKEGRNLKLLQEAVKREPDNYEMWGFLGQEYVSMGEWEQAEEIFWKAAKMMWNSTEKLDYRVGTCGVFLNLLKILEERPETTEDKFMEVYKKAMEKWPKEPDFDYLTGLYFVSRNFWRKGETHLRKAFDILEQYGTAFGGIVLTGNIQKAYELLAVCCYNNGDLAGCVQFTTVLLREDPYLMSTVMMLLRAFSMDQQIRSRGQAGAAEVTEFLGKHFYDFTTLKDRLFVLRAAMSAGYGELVESVRGLFSPLELQSVDQALKNV